tara:strand:- start:1093 stop:1965 length:873 start_codon:yes stop_codon:yes gene_type:complete
MKLKINFADFWPNFVATDNYFYHLLSSRYDVEISDSPDILFYADFGSSHKECKASQKVYYTGENKRPNFNECDFAFSFDYSENPRNYRLPLWALWINWFGVPHCDKRDISYLTPLSNLIGPRKASDKPKFCNFIFSNHTGLRVPLFNEISMYSRVDSAGSLMNNMGQRIPGRGDQKPKVDFISDYRFTIAAENSSYPGYTTEKLLHPLSIGSIPIYWGSPVASLDFNSEAFINVHDFDDLEEVVDLIEEIEHDEGLYRKYVTAPVFPENKIPDLVRPESVVKFFEEKILC